MEKEDKERIFDWSSNSCISERLDSFSETQFLLLQTSGDVAVTATQTTQTTQAIHNINISVYSLVARLNTCTVRIPGTVLLTPKSYIMIEEQLIPAHSERPSVITTRSLVFGAFFATINSSANMVSYYWCYLFRLFFSFRKSLFFFRQFISSRTLPNFFFLKYKKHRNMPGTMC